MLTERDRQIVDWIGRLGAANVHHVTVRFAMGQSRAYRRLSHLVRDGLLTERRLMHAEPGLFVATAAGLRMQRLGRLGVFHVTPAGFAHAREVGAAAAAIAVGSPTRQLLGEREIRQLERELNRPVASIRVGREFGLDGARHLPDLALVAPDGSCVPIEVELSMKAPRRLDRILTGYARARHVSHVYYLSDGAAARGVERAVARTRSHDRIRVIPVHSVKALIAQEQEVIADASA